MQGCVSLLTSVFLNRLQCSCLRLEKKMRLATLLVLSLLLCIASAAQQPAPTPAKAPVDDDAAIKQAALDYIEGFYEGSPERMERALHPDLAKRIVRTNPQGQNNLGQMSALSLVAMARTSAGHTPKEKQQKDITILDKTLDMAMVKLVAGDWVDYMHLAKWNGQWKIVNVLWQMKPKN
jgi:hypothetical protein